MAGCDGRALSGRFAKGASGNPAGRPRKAPVMVETSAFDIIIERTLTVIQNGKAREITIDEALQQKTYQDAIGGSRLALREIMKMIEKREKVLNARRPRESGIIIKLEPPRPDNAEAALLLLDIVAPVSDRYERTSITTWAFQLAINRRRGGFTAEDIDRARRDAVAPDDVRWPRAIVA